MLVVVLNAWVTDTNETRCLSNNSTMRAKSLSARVKRILRLDRLRLRGPCGARDEFLLAATAQNLRKLAKLVPVPSPILI